METKQYLITRGQPNTYNYVVVGKYSNKKRARTQSNKLDLIYGAYVHVVREDLK
jgi:hypothetical protein